MTGQAPKIYAKTGDNGRTRFQHFCGECGSPLFTSGEGGPDDWGIRWGSIRQRDSTEADAANLVPVGSPLDQRSREIAGSGDGVTACDLAPMGMARLKKRPRRKGPRRKGPRRKGPRRKGQGRLAQLVRASRLHREGREFEISRRLPAFAPKRGFGWASQQGEGCRAGVAEQRRRNIPQLISAHQERAKRPPPTRKSSIDIVPSMKPEPAEPPLKCRYALEW